MNAPATSTIVLITGAPVDKIGDDGLSPFMHPAGFQVLEWDDGDPVVALRGSRVPLRAADGWSWDRAPQSAPSA